jgi:hypothetical protein
MERKRYKILMITTGFAPYEFSEAIVNSKLVLALKNAGHEVDVISRESQQVYAVGWSKIWRPLKESTFFVADIKGNKFSWLLEIISSFFFFKYPIQGIRWGYKVYKLAIKMHSYRKYDILLTRMPSEIPHLIGEKIHYKLNIPWIANWNDPTDNIRPLYEKKVFPKSIITNLLVRDIFKHATLNTYPSKELWKYFNAKILKTDSLNVEIIPHVGIVLDTKIITMSDRTRDFTMCHAGYISSLVNIEPFLQALLKLKHEDRIEFKLHLFGLVDDKILESIKDKQLRDNIICHPSLGYELMLTELIKYDILVLLEAQYDTGILLLSKLSDYASVGKPILCISPNTGVIPDYLNKFGGGLSVDNRESESIYNGLKIILLEWRNSWPNMKYSSTERLFSQFSPEYIVGQYEHIFSSIIHKKLLVHDWANGSSQTES